MEILIVIIILIGALYFSKQKQKKHKKYLEEVLNKNSYNKNNEINLSFKENIQSEPYCLVLDTETTGLIQDFNLRPTKKNIIDYPDNFPNIVSISWALFSRNEEIISEGNYLIKQKQEIPIEAIKIHGITTEKCNNEGVEINFVLEKLYSDCEKAKCIVGHNIMFDKKVIEYEFILNNMKKPFTNKTIYDTMRMGQTFMNVNKFPKLSELCIFIYGNKISEHLNEHNSMYDTFFTAKCFFYLKGKKGYYWNN